MIQQEKMKISKLGIMADKALKSAIRKLVLQRRKTGSYLVVWRNGKVVKVPASRIKLR